MLKPHNYVMTRLYSGQAATIPRSGHKEMGTSGPWNWRLTVPTTTKMTLVRPQMTNLKMTLRDDCAVSPCSAPSPTPSVKALTPAYWGGGGGGRTLDRSLAPSPYQVPAPEMKQTFPFTNLACLLAFEGQVATTGLRSGPKSPLFR